LKIHYFHEVEVTQSYLDSAAVAEEEVEMVTYLGGEREEGGCNWVLVGSLCRGWGSSCSEGWACEEGGLPSVVWAAGCGGDVREQSRGVCCQPLSSCQQAYQCLRRSFQQDQKFVVLEEAQE